MSSCTNPPVGNKCLTPSDWSGCRPWDMAAQSKTNCYADQLNSEALNIAGAVVNIYKLLGVHEQTKLVDLTGQGSPISGGDAAGFPAKNAFNTTTSVWKSVQAGSAALTASAYIGYDFGVQRIANGRQAYGNAAPNREHVTSLKIKQSANPQERVAKVRIERSDDGKRWYGVAIVQLPDDENLNLVHFKHSVPSRFWRLRPTQTSTPDCVSWVVLALELFDYSVTHLSNIQDKVLMENRDRDYSQAPLSIKGFYQNVETMMDLSMFGSQPPITYQIKLNFSTCVAVLGRPVVVGDIIELPSEAQYSASLEPVKLWLEVTDVSWDTTSYTPGWMPTMLMITAKPALASQETQDIFGDLSQYVDTSGAFATDDGNSTRYQDYSAITQAITAEAKMDVPQRGSEGSNTVAELSPETIAAHPAAAKLSFNRRGLFVEDAIPQNGASYTEGPQLPTSAANGEYHRLTYEGSAKDVPARLYRWSTAKNRWIYVETDRRSQHDNRNTMLEEYINSPHKKWATEIK